LFWLVAKHREREWHTQLVSAIHSGDGDATGYCKLRTRAARRHELPHFGSSTHALLHVCAKNRPDRQRSKYFSLSFDG
jgi:hypothetical protein